MSQSMNKVGSNSFQSGNEPGRVDTFHKGNSLTFSGIPESDRQRFVDMCNERDLRNPKKPKYTYIDLSSDGQGLFTYVEAGVTKTPSIKLVKKAAAKWGVQRHGLPDASETAKKKRIPQEQIEANKAARKAAASIKKERPIQQESPSSLDLDSTSHSHPQRQVSIPRNYTVNTMTPQPQSPSEFCNSNRDSGPDQDDPIVFFINNSGRLTKKN